MPTTADPAIALCFTVKVDGHDLGAFTSCEGLGCEVAIEAREEGGNNRYTYQLPGRIKYTNIRFTRAIDSDSSKVASWFATMAGQVKRSTAEIKAMTLEGTVIASWALQGVIPVKWQGPQFGAESVKAATETIEFAHHGFLNA